jgi:acetyl esterase/lipase
MTRDHLPITPQANLNIEEFTVSARDGHLICVRAYSQTDCTDLPLLIYLHGGGFVTGGLETDDDSCRALAAQIPLVVLNVEYRLAPENKFPVGFEDSFDVVRWVSYRQRRISRHAKYWTDNIGRFPWICTLTD